MWDNNVMPTPFTVVIDTREQHPFEFADYELGGITYRALTVRKKLDTGDYALLGFEDVDGAVVERKTIQDLCASLIQERFWNECERLQQHAETTIVVEGNYEDARFCTERDHPGMSWESMSGLLNRLIRTVPVVFCSTASDAAHFTLKALRKFHEHKMKEIKSNIKNLKHPKE